MEASIRRKHDHHILARRVRVAGDGEVGCASDRGLLRRPQHFGFAASNSRYSLFLPLGLILLARGLQNFAQVDWVKFSLRRIAKATRSKRWRLNDSQSRKMFSEKVGQAFIIEKPECSRDRTDGRQSPPAAQFR